MSGDVLTIAAYVVVELRDRYPDASNAEFAKALVYAWRFYEQEAGT